MSEGKNIYQRINAIMKDCDYIQKEKAQQGQGVKYDTVIAMLRDLLIKHGVVTVMRQKSLERVGEVGQNQKVYQGEYEMDLVNMDKPDEKVTHSTFAQGMDGGDKAPGKAHTYAAKLILTKAFNIETGIDEESRAEKLEKLNTITEAQQDELANLIDGGNKLWQSLGKAYGITHLNMITSVKFEEVKLRIDNYRKSQNANN